MIKIFFLSIITLMLVIKAVAQNNSDDIIGRWMSTQNNLEVEIFKDADQYNARVVWIDDSNDKNRPMNVRCDRKNPNVELRNRKIIGLKVLYGLVYNADCKEWMNGKIYDPENGKEWNAKAWLTKEGILKVRGYWNFELAGKWILFKKTK